MTTQCLISGCDATPQTDRFYCIDHDGVLRFQSKDDTVREGMYRDWFQYLIAKLCDQSTQGASLEVE